MSNAPAHRALWLVRRRAADRLVLTRSIRYAIERRSGERGSRPIAINDYRSTDFDNRAGADGESRVRALPSGRVGLHRGQPRAR